VNLDSRERTALGHGAQAIRGDLLRYDEKLVERSVVDQLVEVFRAVDAATADQRFSLVEIVVEKSDRPECQRRILLDLAKRRDAAPACPV
jgi:hypothetical protein